MDSLKLQVFRILPAGPRRAVNEMERLGKAGSGQGDSDEKCRNMSLIESSKYYKLPRDRAVGFI